MHWSIFLVAAVLVPKTDGNNLLDLAMDFTSVENTGRIRVCNFITCWGSDNVLLMKETSSTFRCSIVVKSPKTPIVDWYVPGILQLFVVDLGCSGTEELLIEAETLELFNDYVLWLVINEGVDDNLPNNDTSAVDVFQNIYVTVLSQVYIANKVSEEKFEIISVYRRHPTERLIYEKLGYWAKEEGVVFTGVRLVSVRRENTEGRVFEAVGVITNNDSLEHLYDLVDPQIDNPTKIYYTFWDLIIEAMNGRMRFIPARDWGIKINGSMSGMLGHIVGNTAEIPVTPLYLTEERLKIVRYIAVGHVFRIKMLFLSPPLSYQNNIYLLPFSNDVWYSCTFLFVVSVILLYIVVHHEDAYAQDGTNTQTRSRTLGKSWIDVIMLNFATICQQDLRIEPKGVCGRIITLYVKILVLFVSVFYSAAILVLLQSSDRSITTIKDIDESNFKIGSHDTPYNRIYMKLANTPIRRSIAAKVSDETGFLTPEEGITRVKNGFYAFNVNTATGYLIVRRLFNEIDCCRLQELDETIMPTGDPMMAVKRNLPYREIINVMFQKIYERGFIKRERLRKSAEKPPCEQNQMSYADVGVIDSQGAFELLLSAFLLSLVIFIAELLVHRQQRRRTQVSVLQYGYYE